MFLSSEFLGRCESSEKSKTESQERNQQAENQTAWMGMEEMHTGVTAELQFNCVVIFIAFITIWNITTNGKVPFPK